MAAVQVSVVVTVTNVLNDDTSLSGAGEVILRARGSNVQAISANVSPSGSNDPEGDGDLAFVLFPGESIHVPTLPSTPVELFAKCIVFQFDGDLANPVLEIIKIV